MNGSAHRAHGRVRSWHFSPAPGLGHAHLQTLAGGLWPARPGRRPVRERRKLPDGDFVDIDWLGTDPARPWALVLPGIAGSLSSPCVARLLTRLHARGYRAGLLNHRGLSGTPNGLATACHAGFTQDLDCVVHELAGQHGPGIVAAFSMGGNILLKWLGEAGANAPLRAAAAISVPFRLAPAARQLGSGKLRLYDRYLSARLRAIVKRKFARRPPPFPVPKFRTLDSLYRFDDCITAPLHGFADAEDYYEHASCFAWLRRIAVPTLVIHARDDPFVPRSALPAETDLSPAVTLELSERGGHAGFLGRGRFGLPRFSLDDHILAFLEGF